MNTCPAPLLHAQCHLRRPLITAVLSISMLTSVRADYASEILSENPIAYYRFDDAVTTTDIPTPELNRGSLGAAGNATLSDTFLRQVAGALPGSANPAGGFVGSGFTVPYNAALNNQGSFSVEVWIKPAAIPDAGALVCPISSWRENTDTFGREGWLIYQGDAATGFNFRTYNKNAAAVALSITTDGGVTAGLWHHVVVTWDNAASIGRIYVNGVLKKTSDVVLPGGLNSRTYEANSVSPFTLGARADNAFAWNGALDEPAYYGGTVLTPAQVLAHYTNGISTIPSPAHDAVVLADAPVGYWRLDNNFLPRTSPIADNLGVLGAAGDAGYHAGAKNTATGPSPASGFPGFGIGNSALSLVTGNGYVGTGQSLLNNRTAFTVTGWVKRGAVHSSRGGYFGQNDVLEVGDGSGGTVIDAVVNARAITLNPVYSGADDQWEFLTVTADANAASFFINGVQVAQAIAPITGYGSSAFPFNIGGGGVFSASGEYFLGEMDEVAVFDKAISPGRIKQFYDVAVGNVAPFLADTVPTLSSPMDVPEGQPYTLSIDPSGTPPFTYQWKLNGVNIAAATGRTYTVPTAAPNTGNPSAPFQYSVVVTNGAGSVTSDSAQVYVTPTLKWTSTATTNSGKWSADVLSPAPLNWKTYAANTPQAYTDAYSVLFDDSAAGTSVELLQDLNPLGVVFDNSAKDYTLSGAFFLRGPSGTGAVKKGTGTVVVAIESFDMDTLEVNAGKWQVGNGTTGSMTAFTKVKVQGGDLSINQATNTIYSPATVVSSGRISFAGSGNLSIAGEIGGAGDEFFGGTGTININARNQVGGAVTINSGTVSFDGSQNFNRLAPGKAVTVNAGATMELRGLNPLPVAENAVSPSLHQATLRIISGGSPVIGAAGLSHAHLLNLGLDASAMILEYSGQGGTHNGESVQLNGNIAVTGSAASTISYGTGANLGNAGISISTPVAPATTVTHTVAVGNAVIGADLIITAELQNTDIATTATTILNKTGAGTLRLGGGINHTFGGTTQVTEGTLEANGSIAGPLVIGSGATLSPGIPVGTFAAGATTLNGSYACEIDGAAVDFLQVNGNLTFGPAAKISFSVLGGGANAIFYEILRCSGTLSGPTPLISGLPAGYALTVNASSISLTRSDVNLQPTLTAVAPSGSENFNTHNGGFSVSTPVSPQTDWTYTTGSWRSNGQQTDFGLDNTSFLTSPVYTLTQNGTVTLSFSHRYSFEAAFDGGAVDVSLNGGTFIRVPGSAFTQNPYNGVLNAEPTHSLKDGPAFVGNSSGHPAFITSICTVATGVKGDRVQVRFVSASDNNTVGDLSPAGWEIDSFAVTGALPNLLALDWPIGIMQYSDNLLPPWTDVIGKGPLLIDTKAAPKRFFRLKP